MQLLKDRILTDGVVKEGNILKVDSFLSLIHISEPTRPY